MLLKEKEVVVVEVAKKVPEPQPKKDTTQNKAKVIETVKVLALVTKVAEKKRKRKTISNLPYLTQSVTHNYLLVTGK